MVYCDQTLHTFTFEQCLVTGLQNGNEASPSIGSAGRCLLAVMLIVLGSTQYMLIKFCIVIHFNIV